MMNNTFSRGSKMSSNKAIVYARKSIDEVGVQENSINLQIDECGTFCSANGLEVIKVFKEEGVSGTALLSSCIQLMNAIESVASCKAKYLVIHKQDRISRSIAKFFQVKAMLAEVGAQLVIVENGLENERDNRFREVLKGLIDEETVITLRKRVSEVLQFKKRNNVKYTRTPPFGFQFNGKVMAVNEAEQLVINRIVQLKETGLSTVKIAKQLNAEGIKNRTGGEFAQMLVWKILNREKAVA